MITKSTTNAKTRFLVLAAILAAASLGCQTTPTEVDTASQAATVSANPSPDTSVKPGINDSFLKPDMDVETFIKRFEGESREIAVHRDAIVEALELKEGMAVADIGAGTGLFLEPLSRGVGANGRLYAVDIAPKFIEHLETRARDEGLPNVIPVLCTDRSTELPPNSVDLAFVCDTYHHFEYPTSTLASLHRALRPGGRLVIVDFHRIPGISREWLLGHVRAGQAIFTAEIMRAGFDLEDEVHVGLKENYLLRFRRLEDAARP